MESKIIRLSSLSNTRDLGGLITKDGRRVKDKKIIRSGELYNACPEDLKILSEEYRVREVIDLRNQTEAHQKPDKLPAGAKYIINPIFDEAQMGMTHEKEMDAETSEYFFVSGILKKESGADFMKGLYREFVNTPSCLSSYHSFIGEFLKDHDGSILFHCSVGKDRAGMGAFFLMSILGVEEKELIEDFMLTNFCIEKSLQKKIASLSKRIDDPRLEEVYRNLFAVRKDYIQTVISIIMKDYGSYEAFFDKGLKITKEETEKLRSMYLC